MKRYTEIGDYSYLREKADGEWVKYSDVEKKLSQYPEEAIRVIFEYTQKLTLKVGPTNFDGYKKTIQRLFQENND